MNKMWICMWTLPVSLMLASVSIAQDDESDNVEEVVVQGLRATQGGAQDIDFFRGEVQQARIPHPSTLTAEGLFSQHDLLLTSSEQCKQLFCLFGESIQANLIAQPEAKILVGLGFATNVQPDKWQRGPLNLVAVVDKSGSMEGHPLDMVRSSLKKITERMRDGDQLTVVLYGDRSHVHLEPIHTSKKNKKEILHSIDAIESSGSTYMEAGLRLGYEVAFDSKRSFKGTTRVMLFTDERPNVGATDANSFIGMARSASNKGVGLTTIGVGQQFGAELATKISSIRGGNLFFVQNAQDVETLYDKEFDYMVSELAHDLRIEITAHPDYSIAGVYGVPGESLGWQKDRTVSITVPTVFLSSKGGAIFFTLAKHIEDAHLPQKPINPGADLASIEMQYVSVTDDKQERYSLAVKNDSDRPSENMQLGHFLVDEFTALHRATSEHYFNNDQEKAYQILNTLKGKVSQSGSRALDGEKELIYALEERFAFISGHGSELGKKSNFAKLWGVWEITRVRGDVEWKRGDKLEFSVDNEYRLYRKEDSVYQLVEQEEYKSNNEQIFLYYHELTLDYRVSDEKLRLKHRRKKVDLRLARSTLNGLSQN